LCRFKELSDRDLTLTLRLCCGEVQAGTARNRATRPRREQDHRSSRGRRRRRAPYILGHWTRPFPESANGVRRTPPPVDRSQQLRGVWSDLLAGMGSISPSAAGPHGRSATRIALGRLGRLPLAWS
jgi:hypothetical protein